MATRVHLLDSLDEAEASLLRKRLDPVVDLTVAAEQLPASDTEILVAGVPTAEQLDAAKQLRAVVIPWAGLPQRTRELLLERPQLTVYNIHYNAAATAEMAIALLLAAAKRLPEVDRSLRAGDWQIRYGDDKLTTLDGKLALVIGYGAIGRRVARSLVGMNMRVTAVRRTATEISDGDVGLVSSRYLDEHLSRTDVIVVAAPMTPETRGLLTAERLAELPDGAIIVNVARGPIIDEKALYTELESGRLRAGIDVWYRYPKTEPERQSTFPSTYPFHTLPSCVLSPHLGGNASDTLDRWTNELADLLNRLASGETVTTQVDVERGY